MKGYYLGEFEEIVLLTVCGLQEGAYGNAVKEEINRCSHRQVGLSAIHAALYRMERKGYLTSQKGEPTKERGGKRKKYFSITPFGLKALKMAEETRQELRSSIPKIVWQV